MESSNHGMRDIDQPDNEGPRNRRPASPSGMGDIDQPDNGEDTPLYIALVKGRTETVKRLLCKGADIRKPTLTRLHIAAFTGDQFAVERLIQEGDEVNAEGHKKLTPLRLAVNENHHHIVDQLIAAGALNTGDGEGMTPLHSAAARGYVNIVKSLLRQGADVNVVDNKGKTPLHYAAYYPNREDVVDALIP